MDLLLARPTSPERPPGIERAFGPSDVVAGRVAALGFDGDVRDWELDGVASEVADGAFDHHEAADADVLVREVVCVGEDGVDDARDVVCFQEVLEGLRDAEDVGAGDGAVVAFGAG